MDCFDGIFRVVLVIVHVTACRHGGRGMGDALDERVSGPGLDPPDIGGFVCGCERKVARIEVLPL